jgi:hypothetical protein
MLASSFLKIKASMLVRNELREAVFGLQKQQSMRKEPNK